MKLPCRDSLLLIYTGILFGFYGTCVIVPVIMTLIENGMIVPLFLSFDLSTFLSILCWVVYKKCKEIEFFHAIVLPPKKPKDRKDDNNYMLLLCFWIEHCAGLEDMHERFLLIDGIFEAVFREIFRELLECYDHNGESVSMSDPRNCSYHEYFNRWGPDDARIKILGNAIDAEKISNVGWYREIPVEMRGITLRQLRAVYANAKRRCVEEKWFDKHTNQYVTPETLNLHHINEFVIKPFTKITKKSFVESLPSTAGTQPPRWFVSHWWGESFRHTLDCISTLVHDFRFIYIDEDDTRGGGMTEDTPLWICAFANNQWALEEDMATDPKQSSFTKAMKEACYRTISILDAGATVFTRIWCIFELYLTLILEKEAAGLWVVYTALGERTCDSNSDSNAQDDPVAVGIIPGGAPGELPDETSAREKHFNFDLIGQSSNIDIKSAEASVPVDRIHILNSVLENVDIDATPPTDHDKFDELNDAVKASFVSSVAVLNAAHNAGSDDVWQSTLTTLSKGVMTGLFKLDFDLFEPRLSSVEARDLMCHLPLTCTGLRILSAHGEECEGAMEGLVEWVKKAKSLKVLACVDCKVGDLERGREAGSRLAAALASNHADSMELLYIYDTDCIDSGNVSDWQSALETMPNLKTLRFIGTDLSEEEKDILRNATHAEYVYL